MPWGPFSPSTVEAAVRAVYPHDQIFMKKIGSIELRCTLCEKSKWAKLKEGHTAGNGSTTRMMGLLYFTINFTQKCSLPLQSVTVHIDVGVPVNTEPVPIFTAHAPFETVHGRPVDRSVRENNTSDPYLTVNVADTGVEAGGVRGKEVETSMIQSHRWSFRAFTPGNRTDSRSTRAGFEWSHDLERETSGLQNTYFGALLVVREEDAPLRLDVRPEATSFKRRFHFIPSRQQVRQSEQIGPLQSNVVEVESFDEFGKPEDFEEYIQRRNRKPESSDTTAQGRMESEG